MRHRQDGLGREQGEHRIPERRSDRIRLARDKITEGNRRGDRLGRLLTQAWDDVLRHLERNELDDIRRRGRGSRG